MLTDRQIVSLVEYVEDHKEFVNHNQVLFDITEGDLLTYLRRTLEAQFSGDSASIAMERAIPVNVLKRIITKLSKLYMDSPLRETENPNDQELIDYYVKEQGIDTFFNDANENFNTYKNCVLELYENEEKLNTRAVPSNGFLPFTFNEVDPTVPEGIIKFIRTDDNKKKIWIYTDEEFIAVDEEGRISRVDENGEPITNPFGVLPFAYSSRSRYLLIPKPDTDLLKMTLNIPVLLTDLAFSSMFLSNPILYTIDANADNMKLSPNMYWNLKSEDPDHKPQVGVIKPEPDLDAQLSMIKDIMALWLQTKNIKATNIGSANVDSAASGIALLIQEMDTTEDRRSQARYFEVLEQDYWRKLATIHNQLASTGQITERRLFSDPANLKVNVTYGSMKVLETKSDIIKRLGEEINTGLTTKARAIRELNPGMEEKEIDELLEEIKGESPVVVVAPNIEETEE